MTDALTTRNAEWLAGLLEGEAFFGENSTHSAPLITLSMTDFDVVEKANRLLGARTIYRQVRKIGKPMWTATICGVRAVSWMMTLYSLLGARRQEQIRSVLAAWRSRGVTNKHKFVCIHGHALTAENVYLVPGHNHRQCRLCRRIRDANLRTKKEIAA